MIEIEIYVKSRLILSNYLAYYFVILYSYYKKRSSKISYRRYTKRVSY